MAKAAVITDLPKQPFRLEQGWEVGFLSKADANASDTPVIGIKTNIDADFLCKRMGLVQLGDAVANKITAYVDDSVKGNMKSGRLDRYLMRQAGSLNGFGFVPFGAHLGGAEAPTPRALMNARGLRAPYIVRRNTAAFLELAVPAGFDFDHDLFWVMEGFRIYPGQQDPVPSQITGPSDTYGWNGVFDCPAGLADGFQKVASLKIPGSGEFKYILTGCTILTTKAPNKGSVSDNFGVMITDTGTNKDWIHQAEPSGLGRYIPASFLTMADSGEPWAQPRYIDGGASIIVDFFTDPNAWAGNDGPGTVEINFNGIVIYG